MIVDASVALKWVLKGEKYQDESLFLLKAHTGGKEKIIVPDLFFYEVANTLATKTELSAKETFDSLAVILKTNLILYHPTVKDVFQSTKLAKKHGTSVYDMLYAVIAKKHKTHLITADDNFLKKTGFKFVKLLKDVEIKSNSNGQQSPS